MLGAGLGEPPPKPLPVVAAVLGLLGVGVDQPAVSAPAQHRDELAPLHVPAAALDSLLYLMRGRRS